MKRIIALLLVMITLLSLCACGKSDKGTSKPSVKQAISDAVRSTAIVKTKFSYANVKSTFTTVTSYYDNGDGTYDVKGYVEVIDDYNDKYKGKFDAVVRIFEETGKGSCDSFDLETPTKSN